jgi:hypothetical protein
MTFTFQYFKSSFSDSGMNNVLLAGGVLGVICYGLAFWSLTKTEETYGKDLNFLEE